MSIRWGIIGAGRIAEAFCADFRKAVDGAILTAVASRSLEKAQKFATQYAVGKAYGSYQELVEDPDVDIVYIATPHNLHHVNTLLCLNHNKAVLCEKPLAVNFHQVNEMIDLAKSKNLFLMEALWTYFLPAIQKAKNWLAQGKIGKMTIIQANFGFKSDFDPDGRLYNPDLAGGALLDIGIYPMALATLMAEDHPVEIKASGALGKTNIDEFNTVLLSFKSGSRAQLSSSLINFLNDDAYIYGTEGYIHIPNFWHAEKAYLYQEELLEVFEDDRQTRGFNFEITAVNQALAQKKIQCDIMPWEQSLKLIQIMDEVRRQINLKYPFE